MSSTTTDIAEYDAIRDILMKLREFKKKHKTAALQDAIANGAFQVHPDYGDVTYVFKDREYNTEHIEIPVWIHDLYKGILDDVC